MIMKPALLAAIGLSVAAAACSPKGSAPAVAPSAEGASHAADLVQLGGSRVSLWLPEKMKRPTRALIYRQEDPLVLATMSELTAPDEKGAKDMLAGARKAAGDYELQEATRGSAKGFLATGPAQAEGLMQQTLVVGDGLAAVTLHVAYEEAGESLCRCFLL